MEVVLPVIVVMFILVFVGWIINFNDILRKMLDKWFCCHLWYVEDKLETKTYKDGENENTHYPIKIEQFLICKHCGKIRKVVAE